MLLVQGDPHGAPEAHESESREHQDEDMTNRRRIPVPATDVQLKSVRIPDLQPSYIAKK